MTASDDRRSELYRDAIRAALVGLLANLTLGGVKLTAGLSGASYALMADAVNSLGDALTSCVVVFALVVAQRPPDSEHPLVFAAGLIVEHSPADPPGSLQARRHLTTVTRCMHACNNASVNTVRRTVLVSHLPESSATSVSG